MCNANPCLTIHVSVNSSLPIHEQSIAFNSMQSASEHFTYPCIVTSIIHVQLDEIV